MRVEMNEGIITTPSAAGAAALPDNSSTLAVSDGSIGKPSLAVPNGSASLAVENGSLGKPSLAVPNGSLGKPSLAEELGGTLLLFAGLAIIITAVVLLAALAGRG